MLASEFRNRAPGDMVSVEGPFPRWLGFHCNLDAGRKRDLAEVSLISTIISFMGASSD